MLTDSSGIETWATIVPFDVGPLNVEGWVRNDNETRRGVYAEVKVTSQGVTLYNEQMSKPASGSGTAYDAAIAMVERGLTAAHTRIHEFYAAAAEQLRTLAQVRDSMDYVVLSKVGRGSRLTRDIAELCMLVYDPVAERPLRLERVTDNVAVAYDAAGVSVARIAYDPDNPKNFRGAGPTSVGYMGFHCILWPEDEEVA
jgi:hypothetical protein